MKSFFIVLLEIFIWIAVLGIVGGATAAGFLGHEEYTPINGPVGALIGAFFGICAAAIICGPALLMLSMNDHLKRIAKLTEANIANVASTRTTAPSVVENKTVNFPKNGKAVS